jgi:septal ring-binding cell division protein DamX
VVVYGDYATRANAVTAVGKLPKPVQKLKPWIRRYSGIQTDIHHTK